MNSSQYNLAVQDTLFLEGLKGQVAAFIAMLETLKPYDRQGVIVHLTTAIEDAVSGNVAPDLEDLQAQVAAYEWREDAV